MKRSSSVPEIIMGCPVPSVAATNLRNRRGISSSQISLPGDLARPAVATTMESSTFWRAPPFSPIPISRLNSPTSRPHRVEQLKKEECIDERQSEKEVMEITNLNQSYEELRVDTDVMDVWPCHLSPSHQPSFLSPSSPLAKLGNSARSRSLTPTSPLPNRTYCRRSCSPILRPSQLWPGQKRKREESYNEVDMDTSPTLYSAKRFHPSTTHRAVSPTISPTLTPNTGNSPLHHSSRKSSSHSESTPLSSPSSLHAGGPLATNPFAVNYDSGNCDHCQSGSASSSGGQSPLLVNASSTNPCVRENGIIGRIAEENRKATCSLVYSQAGELRNDLHIETTGLSDQISDVPSPLSPKGLQFRHRPFPLSSSSLQSPIPRSIGSIVNPAVPTPSRYTPLPMSKSSSLQHDKYLSPFSSDPGHQPGHAHTHPHSHANPHRQLHRLRTHLSASSVPVTVHRLQAKQEQGSVPDTAKTFSSRLSVHSPLSKLSVSTSVEEYHCTGVHSLSTCLEGRREGGGGRGMSIDSNRRCVRKKRRNSEVSLDGRDESLMESDSSLTESCDEGIEMATNAKQT